MGWYDAYKGNTAAVNLNGITSDTGSAFKNLGDAFGTIGKNMNEAEARKEKSKVADASIAADNAKTALLETQNTAALDTIDNSKVEREQKQIDDSLKSAYGNYKTKADYENNVGGTQLGSADVHAAADKFFQDKFNNEATRVAVTEPWGNYKAFAAANPELVKSADGATNAAIDKHFTSKDMTEATIASKENSAKNQIALLNKEQEISNLTAAKNKAETEKTGHYTQETDTKIANIVSKAMGLDANNIDSWDKDKQAEFLNTTTGVAKIAKEYNVTPLIAVDMFNKVNATKATQPANTKPADDAYLQYLPK